jgi:hypothetical protein
MAVNLREDCHGSKVRLPSSLTERPKSLRFRTESLQLGERMKEPISLSHPTSQGHPLLGSCMLVSRSGSELGHRVRMWAATVPSFKRNMFVRANGLLC